ncbi:nuclear transport factor 2 family protein [Pseudomonadota bacterium AL_CKDN230030165-1A_HGKHYDSX7]
MKTSIQSLLLAMTLAAPATASASNAEHARATKNAALVEQAFDNWQQGKGSVFDLLAEDVQWTVAGDSPVSGVYRSRERFLADAVQPITDRLATPITPDVKHIVAQGNQVVVIWDGVATAKSGARYENSYAWHMTLADGRITNVDAFLDTWRLVQLME